MAQAYSTGAAHMFVAGYSIGGTSVGSISYLGTAEHKPNLNHEYEWSQVMNDLAGQRIPYDVSYQGKHGFCTATLTRWNEAVYQRLADLCANFYQPSEAPGVDEVGDIGSLMLTEGLGLVLYIQFPYSQYQAYQNPQNGAMPKGYRYPAAIFSGPDRIDAGTDPFSRTIQFHMLRAIDPTKPGRYTLYDNNMTGLPSIN